MSIILLLIITTTTIGPSRCFTPTPQSYVPLDNEIGGIRMKVTEHDWDRLFPVDDRLELTGSTCPSFSCYPQPVPPMFFCINHHNLVQERICYDNLTGSLFRCTHRTLPDQRYFNTIRSLVICLTQSKWPVRYRYGVVYQLPVQTRIDRAVKRYMTHYDDYDTPPSLVYNWSVYTMCLTADDTTGDIQPQVCRRDGHSCIRQ